MHHGFGDKQAPLHAAGQGARIGVALVPEADGAENLLGAAFRFRLPSTGTVPHALIQLFDTEREAFEAIADTYNRYTLLLDTAGLSDVKISASVYLDEFSITDLFDARAPIDSFGVGTSLGVGAGSVERDIEGARRVQRLVLVR